MSFEWKDFLTIAGDFIKQDQHIRNEAYMRSAISRAYYGVFCTSRDKAGLTGYRPRPKTDDPGVHKKIIITYKTSTEPAKQQVGKTLDELRKKRNKADYEKKDIVITKEQAERAIIMADEILYNLNNSP